MEVEAAKLIGARLSTIALAGAGIGIGNIFASYVSAAIRNPSAAPKVFGNVLLGFALTEAIALFALLTGLLRYLVGPILVVLSTFRDNCSRRVKS